MQSSSESVMSTDFMNLILQLLEEKDKEAARHAFRVKHERAQKAAELRGEAVHPPEVEP